ncbi:MAG: hypothetical protein R3B41_03970 [Candidatus Doudnabacteria bacterium]
MKNIFLKTKTSQSGQTLIETLVAAFVLVMGISASIGLASYSLRATTLSTKQIIAMGLAREGVEAVKNMRDTNWLRSAMTTNCFNYFTQASNASCYQNWLSGGTALYNIAGATTGTNYRLGIDQAQATAYWKLTSATNNYGLNLNTTNPTYGFYIPGTIPTLSGTSVTASNTKFGRRITILQDGTFAPFSSATYLRRVKVSVDVWWADGTRCPVSDTPPTGSKCHIKLETYLTNWKNYEL